MQRSPIPSHQPLLDRALLSRIPLMVLASVISTFGWFAYRTSLGIPTAQGHLDDNLVEILPYFVLLIIMNY